MEKVLPKNWVKTSPKEIANIIRGVPYGKNDASQENFDGSCLILRGGNIQDGKIVEGKDNVFVDLKLIKKEQFIQKGDVVIVGSTGSKQLIGKAATVLESSSNISFGAFLMNIRAYSNINKSFFSYYFQTDYYRSSIRELAGGVNINNIRKEYIESLYFPLPPLSEQNRIVEKLDRLFGQLEVIKISMEKIPFLLKNFRQQVLTQAVTGKLTEEWREGKELISSISQIIENRKKYYDNNLIANKQKGLKIPKKLDNTEFESSEFSITNKIPSYWNQANLKNIADLITDGEHATPKRTEDGYYLLSARNVQNGYLSLSNVDYVPEDEYLRIKNRCNPEYKDILISCSGTVGRVSMVPENLQFVMVRSAALVKFQSNTQISKFIEFVLRSNFGQSQILNLQKSTAQANLFLAPIGRIIVPLPSLEEIQQIVSRVESLFAKADAIEEKYKNLKTKIETLPQTILHKAFKGELSEQLETDGDARDLLEEIAALKNGGKAKKAVAKKYVQPDEVLRIVAEADATE